MPTIEVSFKELKNLSKLNFKKEKMQDVLLTYLKADVENMKGDKMSIKLEDTNRPDLWCVEGLAKNLRNLFGKKSKNYKIKKSDIIVDIDKKLKDVRPYAACAVVKNIKISKNFLKSIIQFQEKLGKSYGRNREKVGLGVYDLDKMNGNKIKYKAAKPDEKFIPLEFKKELSLKEILKKHPKGQEYAHLLKGKKMFPVFEDESKQILSMPPIINAHETGKVTEKSKNLFIEATGTDFETVMHALNLFAMAFAEQNGEIYSTKLKYNYKNECGFEFSPKFDSKNFNIKSSYIDKILGLGLTSQEIKKLLIKMGYTVKKVDISKDLITIEIPFYRKDVIHAVDIVEDVAIAYDYNKIKPLEPKVYTKGKLLEQTEKYNNIRELMVGMKFQEVLNFTFTSKKNIFEKMNRKKGKALEVIKPISSNYSHLRDSILPMILDFLEKNKTVEFPQRIFELGHVLIPDNKKCNKVKQQNNLCAAISHSKATFTEIKSVLDTLAKQLNLKLKVKHKKHTSFISGRCGEIFLGRKSIGIIGEIHPRILRNFNLENPVCVLELNVDLL